MHLHIRRSGYHQSSRREGKGRALVYIFLLMTMTMTDLDRKTLYAIFLRGGARSAEVDLGGGVVLYESTSVMHTLSTDIG
jgi:hypothetical protein